MIRKNPPLKKSIQISPIFRSQAKVGENQICFNFVWILYRCVIIRLIGNRKKKFWLKVGTNHEVLVTIISLSWICLASSLLFSLRNPLFEKRERERRELNWYIKFAVILVQRGRAGSQRRMSARNLKEWALVREILDLCVLSRKLWLWLLLILLRNRKRYLALKCVCVFNNNSKSFSRVLILGNSKWNATNCVMFFVELIRLTFHFLLVLTKKKTEFNWIHLFCSALEH